MKSVESFGLQLSWFGKPVPGKESRASNAHDRGRCPRSRAPAYLACTCPTPIYTQ
jgi:hypothetical protein